jgi:large subunit ribosomal protein L25
MKTIAMFGNARTTVGKVSTKALRAEGKVPCVLYGGKENIQFSMYEPDFKMLVYTPNTYKVKLAIDGNTYHAFLKDIQYHPVNDTILHVDFLEISENKPVEVSVPVRLVGNSIGVRQGGKLLVKAKKLRVRALPNQLPDAIELNIETLEIGKSMKVADVKAGDLQLLDSPNNPIVTIKTTRAAQEAAKGDEGGKKKK